MNPRSGALINPRVRLLRPLSEGAMGSVWVAEHLTLETEVAVKFISADLSQDPQVLERFQREAKAAAQIKSPNVVQTLDHGVTDEGLPYIVMELMEGQSLADMLEEGGPLGLLQTAAIVTQVARALGKAHSLGIIHRDIKPANIFLLEEDAETTGADEQHVKVLDFGIAKHTEVPEGITVPGMVIGTPGYMCPDQVLHSKEVGPEADLWSLSVVAYHALTGKLPFYGETLAKLVGALIRAEFKPPSELRGDIPASVDRFFERAFHKETEKRFASAAELASAFRDAVESKLTAERTGAQQRAALERAREHVEQAGLDEESARSDKTPRRLGMEVTNEPRLTLSSLQEITAKPNRLRSAGLAALGITVGVGLVLALRGNHAITGETAGAPSASSPSWGAPSSAQIPIEAGSFTMGCSVGETGCTTDEEPARRISLDAFVIDRTEVTVAQYRECVDEDACSIEGLAEDPVACNWSSSGRDQHPINCVSWQQAQAYCRWAGGSLPSEAQWERAARGETGRTYPWGDEPAACGQAIMSSDEGAGCGRQGTWQVGSRPHGAGPGGVLDMAGNVREWVADWYSPVNDAVVAANPVGPPQGEARVLRGGGYLDKAEAVRATARDKLAPDAHRPDVGFRCVRAAAR